MKLASVHIQNYRAHVDTKIPLSQFGCLIGENNAGKSSVLHALQFVLEEKKLLQSDFADLGTPASVTVHFSDITPTDISRIADAHKVRVEGMIRDGNLAIVRTQESNGTAESRYLDYAPVSDAWDDENLEAAIAGKKASALRAAALALEPKFDALLPSIPKIAEVREAWGTLKRSLPSSELVEVPTKFATGISAGLRPLFPSVIYIEAVKDAATEIKSTGTATFSKLLEMLFGEVKDQLGDIEKEFANVHRKLSRVLSADGQFVDTRLPEVAMIENTIQNFVQSSFPGVKLRINVPAPTLSTILTGAELEIDDGHIGLVSSKGDGLKRTVLFAILRAYTELRGRGLGAKPATAPNQHSYLLLFEEPELYLHPRAQRQLMATLESFAKEHQVLVTTHSPGFFTPTTSGFAKLRKEPTGVRALPVAITLGARDAYQVIHHENNEAAFFARDVVLVEGDSDTITFPHLAKVFSPFWDQNDRNIMFVKTEGKGSISRYRDFFDKFEVPVHVITDLDSLVDGFAHLTRNEELKRRHSDLLGAVNAHLPATNAPNSKKVRSIIARRNAAELWTAAQEQLSAWKESQDKDGALLLTSTIEELFKLGQGASKVSILAAPPTDEIAQLRDSLIEDLARERVHVLTRGDLETYCGSAGGADKVAASIAFCEEVTSLETYESRVGVGAQDMTAELRGIFTAIYGVADDETPIAGATTSIAR